MPESSQPPCPPVSTVARMLATVALLHGGTLDGGGLDATTATALVDAVAYLTSTGDTDGADALLRLATTDPDTIAATHVALHVPARRPDSTAPTGEPPPPPLPRRTPSPYRDPGQPDPAGRSNATPTATEPHLTAIAGGSGARLAGAGRTDDPGDSDGSGKGAEPPLSESRRWQEATAAQVLLLDYAVPDAEGKLTGVYTPVPVVHPPGWCDHLDTICGACLTGWSEDHAVAVFRHGVDGAATGCRCPVCRTTVPARSPAHSPAQLDRHPDTGQIPGNTSGSTASRDTSWFGAEES